MKKSFYVKKRSELKDQEKNAQSTLSDVQRRIAALDIVWNEICGGSSLEFHADSDNSAIVPVSQNSDTLHPKVETEFAYVEDAKASFSEINSIFDEVGNFINSADGPFKATDIIENMGRDPNRKIVRSAVYAAMKSFEANGKIVVVVPAAGRRAGTYKRSVA